MNKQGLLLFPRNISRSLRDLVFEAFLDHHYKSRIQSFIFVHKGVTVMFDDSNQNILCLCVLQQEIVWGMTKKKIYTLCLEIPSINLATSYMSSSKYLLPVALLSFYPSNWIFTDFFCIAYAITVHLPTTYVCTVQCEWPKEKYMSKC